MDKQLIKDNFPVELLRKKKWVGYKLEQKPNRKKLDKVPKIADTNINADITQPRDWRSLSVVLRNVDQYHYDGIGVCINFNDPYVVIDIDDCREPITGKIKKYAVKIISEINSYTEISPSGTGIHIIAKGQLPIMDRINKNTKVEMYDCKRFFTATGNILGYNKKICERMNEVKEIHEKYVRKNTKLLPSDSDFDWDEGRLAWEQLPKTLFHQKLSEYKTLQAIPAPTTYQRKQMDNVFIDIFPEMKCMMSLANLKYIRTLPENTKDLFHLGNTEDDAQSFLHRILMKAISKWQPNRGIETCSFRNYFLHRVHYCTGALLKKTNRSCYKRFRKINIDNEKMNKNDAERLIKTIEVPEQLIVDDFIQTLTARRQNILKHLLDGYKQIEICDLEDLSYKSVKKHVSKIREGFKTNFIEESAVIFRRDLLRNSKGEIGEPIWQTNPFLVVYFIYIYISENGL